MTLDQSDELTQKLLQRLSSKLSKNDLNSDSHHLPISYEH